MSTLEKQNKLTHHVTLQKKSRHPTNFDRISGSSLTVVLPKSVMLNVMICVAQKNVSMIAMIVTWDVLVIVARKCIKFGYSVSPTHPKSFSISFGLSDIARMNNLSYDTNSSLLFRTSIKETFSDI